MNVEWVGVLAANGVLAVGSVLRAGDIIVSINRQAVSSITELPATVARSPDTLLLNLRRGNVALRPKKKVLRA